MRAALAIITVAALGCGPADRDRSEPQDAPTEPCVGIACQIENCKPRGLPETSISGTIFAPNGTLALYGATIYVPMEDPGPVSTTVECSRCQKDPPGGAAAATISDVDGRFLMTKVPSGDNIPLVISIGKWRRKLVLPHVDACTANPLPVELTALPKNRTEGDIPQIAISTGACDALECLIRKLGVDDSEFTTPDGTGAVHLYESGGAKQFADNTMFPPSKNLWGEIETLKKYDIVLNSCECSQNADTAGNEKTQAMMDNMKSFADAGGRVFLSHYANVWLEGAAATPTLPARAPAVWPSIATCDPIGDVPDYDVAVIDQQANPKGMAFAAWMKAVGGSSTGFFPLAEGKKTCDAIDGNKAERWLYIRESNELQTFQFTTPNEGSTTDRCGKVVFSDMHVASGSTSLPGQAFPNGCSATPMTPQEKALAFMMFDIASCVGEIE